jgi:hypothetical protein
MQTDGDIAAGRLEKLADKAMGDCHKRHSRPEGTSA